MFSVSKKYPISISANKKAFSHTEHPHWSHLFGLGPATSDQGPVTIGTVKWRDFAVALGDRKMPRHPAAGCHVNCSKTHHCILKNWCWVFCLWIKANKAHHGFQVQYLMVFTVSCGVIRFGHSKYLLNKTCCSKAWKHHSISPFVAKTEVPSRLGKRRRSNFAVGPRPHRKKMQVVSVETTTARSWHCSSWLQRPGTCVPAVAPAKRETCPAPVVNGCPPAAPNVAHCSAPRWTLDPGLRSALARSPFQRSGIFGCSLYYIQYIYIYVCNIHHFTTGLQRTWSYTAFHASPLQ